MDAFPQGVSQRLCVLHNLWLKPMDAIGSRSEWRSKEDYDVDDNTNQIRDRTENSRFSNFVQI